MSTSKKNPTPTFGERVRKHREKAGLSFRQAEAASGVNKGNIVRAEEGKVPSIGTFSQLCKWMKLRDGAVVNHLLEFLPQE